MIEHYSLADYLVEKQGILKNKKLIDAFRAVDRKDFVTEQDKDIAYADHPLEIGYGQTISQPYTVAFMLELLEPQAGNIVMDVGSGSGWTSALLAYVVGKEGKVYAIERVPELCRFGRENVAKYPQLAKRVDFLCQDATDGLPEFTPDRILVSASANAVPDVWRETLAVGGRMGIPIRETVTLFIKRDKNEFEKHEYPGFVFVPLVKN